MKERRKERERRKRERIWAECGGIYKTTTQGLFYDDGNILYLDCIDVDTLTYMITLQDWVRDTWDHIFLQLLMNYKYLQN